MNQNEFVEALKELNIEINDLKLAQLHTYYELLISYNKVMNLTGITEEQDVYLKHFYDSLTICKVIDLNNVESLCDIGTGAGFPGLVLKIIFPNLKVDLVDSLHKRLVFLKEVIKQLDLKNIQVIEARAEEYAINNREKYDIVTARAVANLSILLEYCIPLVKIGGYFIPLKGNVQEELESSKNAITKLSCILTSTCEFLLPKENSIRTILKYQKEKITDKRFPRKYGEMKKKPL